MVMRRSVVKGILVTIGGFVGSAFMGLGERAHALTAGGAISEINGSRMNSLTLGRRIVWRYPKFFPTLEKGLWTLGTRRMLSKPLPSE